MDWKNENDQNVPESKTVFNSVIEPSAVYQSDWKTNPYVFYSLKPINKVTIFWYIEPNFKFMVV